MVIGMERKMFGQGSRFGSPKEHLLKMIRLIRGSGTIDVDASSYTDANEDQGQLNTYSQTYKTVDQRMHEMEAVKAMLVAQSRHYRWKAGGPI
jgi:hypothetical protein